MTSIGIVGAGVAGLHLGLYLRQQGIETTIYAERTPGQEFGSRIPALVARVGHTRERERKLGINHWDNGNNESKHVNVYVAGEQPMAFHGTVTQPLIAVDMRIYCGRLLEDFTARGGRVVAGAVQAGDLGRLSADHDLLVVASGRAGLLDVFPRLRESKLVKSSVLKEARATFSVTPGLDEYRPQQRTGLPGLYLAGDWTATDWPSTMEGAIRSGRLAAGELTGARARFLSPELPATGLMRFLSTVQ